MPNLNLDETVEPVPEERPTYSLYSVHAVVLAAFLGSPVAAGIVMAVNYSRLGRSTAAWQALSVGLLASGALFAAAFLIPDDLNIPNVVYQIPVLAGAYYAAENLQGKLIQRHMAHRGKIASMWGSAGIGIACLIVVMALIAGGVLATLPDFGESVAFGADEVYYKDGATAGDARTLGTALQQIDYFTGNGATARVQKPDGKYVVSFVVIDGTWEQEESVKNFTAVGVHLATNVLKTPLTVQLCDNTLVSKRTIPIRSTESTAEPPQ